MSFGGGGGGGSNGRPDVKPNVTPSPNSGPPVNANLQPSQPYWNGSQFVVPGYQPYSQTQVPPDLMALLSQGMQQRLGSPAGAQALNQGSGQPQMPTMPGAPQMPLGGAPGAPGGGMMAQPPPGLGLFGSGLRPGMGGVGGAVPMGGGGGFGGFTGRV